MKYVKGQTIHPYKYNIILTRDDEELDFTFPPAPIELITRYGYLAPVDPRCTQGLVQEEEDLYDMLKPVLGSSYKGNLAYHTRKQVIIALHDTAILGYQRQSIIDPRISNEVALFWEIYLDQRIFPSADEMDWQQLMAEVIASELHDDNADQSLAEDIKNRLLEQS
jgi:hypothetical protein